MIGWLIRRLVRVPLLLLRSPLLLLAALADRLAKRPLLLLRFRGPVPERGRASKLQRMLPGHIDRLSLGTALTALREAAADGATQVVALQLDRAALGLIEAEQLLTALEAVRAAGKKVVLWVDGSTGPALMLSAGAEKVLVTPTGDLEFLGLRVRAIFLRGLLDRVGVVPELQHHGDYKTASDMFTHTHMSPAHKDMATDLGRDLYDQILGPLVIRRELSRETLEGLIDQAPLSNERAVGAGLFHKACYRDELIAEAGALIGVDEPKSYGPGRLLARQRRRRRLGDAFRDRPQVAVLTLKGAIVSGDEGKGICSLTAIESLEELREDDDVRAVVLRIDSPGGSALASDEIWREVRRLDEAKPVVASMGHVAASGGYYIAVGARRIVAHAGTLTGSIGVVSGKLQAGPLFHRLGIGFEGISFGARAGIYDPDRGFEDDERQAAYDELMRVYRVFVARVAKGRDKTVEEIDALAQGRVYTGRLAKQHGLVDLIGDETLAVAEACRLANLRGEPQIVYRSPPKHGWQALTSKDAAKALLSGLADLTPGPNGRQLGSALLDLAPALLLGRERVFALAPWELDGI